MRQEFGVEPCLTQMAVAHGLVKKVERDYIEIALDAEFQGVSAGLFLIGYCHMRPATRFDNCRQGRNDRRRDMVGCSTEVCER